MFRVSCKTLLIIFIQYFSPFPLSVIYTVPIHQKWKINVLAYSLSLIVCCSIGPLGDEIQKQDSFNSVNLKPPTITPQTDPFAIFGSSEDDPFAFLTKQTEQTNYESTQVTDDLLSFLSDPPTASTTQSTLPPTIVPFANFANFTPSSRNSSSSSSISSSQAPSLPPRPKTPFTLDSRYLELGTKKWIARSSLFKDISYHADPVQVLIDKTFVQAERPSRKLISVEDVQALDDDEAFGKILAAGSFKTAALLAQQRLQSQDQQEIHPGMVQQINKLWLIRLTSLLNLKQYDNCIYEAEHLGILLEKSIDPIVSIPGKYPHLSWTYDPCIDLFPDQKKEDTLISFELRNFHALWPSFSKKDYIESINRLYTLLYWCKKKIGAQSSCSMAAKQDCKQTIFKLNVQISNCLVHLKEYLLAISLLTETIRGLDDVQGNSYISIKSCIGRCYLHFGDLENAKKVFEELEYEVLNNVLDPVIPTECLSVSSEIEYATKIPESLTHPQLIENRALLFTALGDFTSANLYYSRLLSIKSSGSGINNLSICQLYIGDVGHAVENLETVLQERPGDEGLSETLLFNLSTMIDLGVGGVERKKGILRNVVSHYAGDGFDVDNLKIQ